MAKLKRRRRRPGEVPTRKEAIRNMCFECMGWENTSYIRECTAKECWLYPYRLGALDVESIEKEKQEVREMKKRKEKSDE